MKHGILFRAGRERYRATVAPLTLKVGVRPLLIRTLGTPRRSEKEWCAYASTIRLRMAQRTRSAAERRSNLR